VNDCGSMEEEINCTCGDKQFQCVQDGRCIPAEKRCNFQPDCVDASGNYKIVSSEKT